MPRSGISKKLEMFYKLLAETVKIFSTNKIKVINKESINYYTKKFETHNLSKNEIANFQKICQNR